MLKLAVEEAVLNSLGGDEESRRKATIISMAARDVRSEKVAVLSETQVLLEMARNLQERSFREQVLNADPKTRAYFN